MVGRVIEVATAVTTNDGEVPLTEPIEIRRHCSEAIAQQHQDPKPARLHARPGGCGAGGDPLRRRRHESGVPAAPTRAELGERTEVRLRYNAWLIGVGSVFVGRRAVAII